MHFETLQSHLDIILHKFSQDEFYERLKEAKKKYFKIAGVVNEEDDEYESKMNLFNDWYLFHFLETGLNSSYVNAYLKSVKLDQELDRSLRNVNYSLYQLISRKQDKIKIKDHFSNIKFTLAQDNGPIGCVDGDVFIGRTLSIDNSFYLLKGMCILPKGIENVLKRRVKKIRRLKDPNLQYDFLLQLESLKIKWLRYGHIEAEKIFNFS